MSPSHLLLATRNAHKQREFAALFQDALPGAMSIVSLDHWPSPLSEVEEDAETFEGNALKKALETSHAAKVSVMAEDSGLVVDALGGAPGVRSARYAAPDATTPQNNAKLARELGRLGDGPFAAHFVSVIALALCRDEVGQSVLNAMGFTWDELEQGPPSEPATPTRHEGRALLWVRGELRGHVRARPQGDQGFGYDPHFYVPSQDATLAQLSMAHKNAISHRAQALGALRALFDGPPR